MHGREPGFPAHVRHSEHEHAPEGNDAPAPGGATDSQVFAALNYGRRVPGANTEYGKSVFELDDSFKKDAIYFAMDTFTPVSNGSGSKAKADRGKLYQVSFNTFGGAILLAIRSQYLGNPSATHLANSKALVADLLASARNGNPRPDSAENHLLVEAHVFRRVRMIPAQVRAVHISRAECGAQLRAIQVNAGQFSQRTNIPVDYID